MVLAMVARIGSRRSRRVACSDRDAEGVELIRWRRLDVTKSPTVFIVTLAASGYAIGSVLAVAFGYSRFFDRYLIPIVPLVAILTLRSGAAVTTSRRFRIAGCATLAALAVLGAVYAANSASFDGTKWSVASQALTLASDAKRIDGGRVWNDSDAGRHLRGHFKGACIVLRAGPRPAADETGVVGAARVWAPTGSTDMGCRTPGTPVLNSGWDADPELRAVPSPPDRPRDCIDRAHDGRLAAHGMAGRGIASISVSRRSNHDEREIDHVVSKLHDALGAR